MLLTHKCTPREARQNTNLSSYDLGLFKVTVVLVVKINTGVKQLMVDQHYIAFQKCQEVGRQVIIILPCRLLETTRCLTGSKLIQDSLLGYLLLLGWYLVAWQTAPVLLCFLLGIWHYLGCLATYSCLAPRET